MFWQELEFLIPEKIKYPIPLKFGRNQTETETD